MPNYTQRVSLNAVNGTDLSVSNPVPVSAVVAESETHIGFVGPKRVQVTATVTRPADTTAYTAGDAIGDSASELSTIVYTLDGALRVTGGKGKIVGARIVTNKKSIVPRIKIHLWNEAIPAGPTANLDNAPARQLNADAGLWLGSITMPAMTTEADTTNSDCSIAESYGLAVPIVQPNVTTAIYFSLHTVDAFTPAASQTFKVYLIIEQD